MCDFSLPMRFHTTLGKPAYQDWEKSVQRIRIKINKFKKQYIQWVKLQILGQKKISKENNENSKLTLKAQNNLLDTCSRKPPLVNSVLQQLHSPTHISSDGLLRYSIVNYTSTVSSKSSFNGQNIPRLHYLADLVDKIQNFNLSNYDHRQLAQSTWKWPNFLTPMTRPPNIM